MMTTRVMMMMTIEAEASSATQQTARQLKVFPSAGDRRQNISQKSSQLENFSQNISQDFSQLVNFSTQNSQQVSQLENFLKNFFAGKLFPKNCQSENVYRHISYCSKHMESHEL